jgi:Holliday junction resolvase RusA-like endonuclease
MTFSFTTYARPEPMGSMRGFVRNGRAILTSNNKKMKPYRQEVTNCAMVAINEAGWLMPLAGKHEPVKLSLKFYFARPVSIPKKRTEIVVKPDIDKIIRATADALTGILYADDAQIVEMQASKHYGTPERVEVSICNL